MGDWILVLAGGAVGAPVRYLIGTAAKARMRWTFPWGTLFANLGACLLLGLFVEAGTGGALDASGQALLSTGFCGALSTWSTFSYELLTLAGGRKSAEAAGYLLVSVVLGLTASFAGAGVARVLW
ncbi:CrcB family protein [Streptomyces werraensis]|uniref:fluoride efflux transporter FluC n=1 Tax=Streptomyces TaxID=1883 RepID=UPI001B36E245|nr:CrcB family protein [Streptomyces sp. B93]MBQ1091400.1 CrcB family protein [Streptomyces sp. B93]